ARRAGRSGRPRSAVGEEGVGGGSEGVVGAVAAGAHRGEGGAGVRPEAEERLLSEGRAAVEVEGPAVRGVTEPRDRVHVPVPETPAADPGAGPVGGPGQGRGA